MTISRRGFIASAATFFAAPAIVRASSLMPVKNLPGGFQFSGFETLIPMDQIVTKETIMADLSAITRRAFVPTMKIQIYDANLLFAAMRSR